jgi:ubiquinone/menaquinone biosynthesis C-methylase UbiE
LGGFGVYLYAWMKFVETAPERYDQGMEFMTGGLLNKIKDDVAAAIAGGANVLDIGCGTATLGIKLVKKGVKVTGLDCSEQMLEIAKKNMVKENITDGQLILIHDSVTQIKNIFADHSFDYIISTAALGEFPREYLLYIFQQCHRILKPGGRLIVADEVRPDGFWAKLLQTLVMTAVWIPQFLLVRRVCYPIKDLGRIISEVGFKINRAQKYGWNSFLLIDAKR